MMARKAMVKVMMPTIIRGSNSVMAHFMFLTSHVVTSVCR